MLRRARFIASAAVEKGASQLLAPFSHAGGCANDRESLPDA
jgi:hypothetical protein